MPLCVSCPGPVLRLFSSLGGWPGPFPPLPCLWSLAPLRECLLLRAGFARCGGITRAPGRGLLSPGCEAPGIQRSSPTPDRPSLGCVAGPATHWLWVRGLCAWGPITNPTARAVASWLCALWGRHVGAWGAGGLLPGCGASAVGRSPSPDRPSLGHAARANYPLAVGAEGVGAGLCHQLHRARSCELALHAVGRYKGTWGGGASCLGGGRPGLGAQQRQTARPRGLRPWLATDWLWLWGVWAWGPANTPTTRALESWLCASGAARGRPEGCLLPACGASGVARCPTPDRPSFGRAAGARYPLAVGALGVGAETRHQFHSARSCALTVRPVRPARGRPGRGASCLCVERPGFIALRCPTARLGGVRPGPATHWLWVRGVWAWKPATNPTTRGLAS